MIKTFFYKLYVLALLALVIWAAKFIYPLIYWNFELKGEETQFTLDKRLPPLEKMRNIRHYLDNTIQTKTIDLGDANFSQHYEPGHFHHVGQLITQSSLNGCDYCHSNIPHFKDREARAFRNMHGYFLACEVCHYYNGVRKRDLSYIWMTTDTREVIQRPTELITTPGSTEKSFTRARGNYGARVIPWNSQTRNVFVILDKSPLYEAENLLENQEYISPKEIKNTLDAIHAELTPKPMKCDACHSDKDVLFPYQQLGYSKEDTEKLMDIAVASVLDEYNKFHFPNLFIRKDDRIRNRRTNRGDQ